NRRRLRAAARRAWRRLRLRCARHDVLRDATRTVVEDQRLLRVDVLGELRGFRVRRELRVAAPVAVRAGVRADARLLRERGDADARGLGLERNLWRVEVIVAAHEVLADVIGDV